MKIIRLYSIILFLPLLFVGCEADINLSNISTKIINKSSVIVPLGTVSVNIGELIRKYYTNPDVVLGNNSEITYQYTDSIDFKFAKVDMLSNMQPFTKQFKLNPDGLPIPPIPENTSLPTITDVGSMDMAEKTDTYDRIDSATIKQATFSVVINQTDLNVPAQNITANISFSGSNSFNVSPIAYGVENLVVMKNFSIHPVNGKLPFTISINSKAGNDPVLLTSNSKFQFSFNIKQLDFDVAYGYFPPTVLSSNIQQFNFTLGNILPGGSIKLSTPKVDVSLKSNIGTYLIFQLDYLKSFINNDTTNSVFATFNGNSTNSCDLIIDKKPSKPNEIIIENFKTFDNENGGINKLLENINKPNTIQYKYALKIDTNFVKQDPTPNFITSDPLIKVNYKISIPFNLEPGSYYEMVDSTSNGFADLSNELSQIKVANIDSMILVLSVTNGLPVKSILQMIFVDQQGQELKSDFQTAYTLNAGNVDADGIVKPGNESKQNIQVLLTKEELDILKTAKTIRYKIRIEGKDLNSKIHFTTNDHIDVKAGVFIKAKVSTVL
jgi:hypothetical protein